MKPQQQDPAIYDCLRTCVAMIFDMDRLEVPNFGYTAIEEGFGPKSSEYGHVQMKAMDAWFAERHIGLFRIHTDEEGKPRPIVPWGICIADGPGPRGYRHAVVWGAGWWSTKEYDWETYGKMLHDPHPSGDGITVEGWTSFCRLE